MHENSGERVFVTLYGVTLLMIRVLIIALDAYARHELLYAEQDSNGEPRRDQRDFLATVAVYVSAIIIGLVAPAVAVAVYFAFAVILVVPFRDVQSLFATSRSSRSESQ
jgi:hypothetical protein